MNFSSDLLLINKPAGCSSMDVIRAIRRLTRIKKVGHAGTLDPLATGLLLVCTGKNTKKITELTNLPKKYQATINFTAFSETDDAEGVITPVAISTIPTLDQIKTVLENNFLGEIEQLPPKYSAIKINGERAYNLARKGETPELKPRNITITKLNILNYNWPLLELEVACSKGTYIRSLARDLGLKLNTGGYLQQLTRTAIGDYTLAQAQEIDVYPNKKLNSTTKD